MHKSLLRCLGLSLFLSAFSLAQAAPYYADLYFRFFAFTVTNPQGVVEGNMNLTLERTTGDILGINSIYLEIGSKQYAPGDLIFGNSSGSHYVGGAQNSFGVSSNSDDFYFSWYGTNSFNASSFRYSTINSFGAYDAANLGTFSITWGNPVPQQPPGNGEPTNNVPDGGATVSLLGLAFVSVALAKRRWSRAA